MEYRRIFTTNATEKDMRSNLPGCADLRRSKSVVGPVGKIWVIESWSATPPVATIRKINKFVDRYNDDSLMK